MILTKLEKELSKPAGKILIVDDDIETQNIILKILSSLTYECVVANNGRQALKHLEKDNFEIVISDIKMPVMDGMELLKHIHNHYPDIAVIMITGHAEKYSYSEILDAGACDFLAKPFPWRELIAKLERVFRERRLIGKLKKTSQMFQTLFESTSEAIILLEKRGFFDCNQAALEMFGYQSKEEFLDLQPIDISPPLQSNGENSLSLASKRVREAINNGRTRFEWILKRQDGNLFPAQVNLTTITIDCKIKLEAVVHDLTQQKELAKTLAQGKFEAERANHLKSAFLANMSHEIRTPMNIIIGMNRLVLEGALTSEQRRYLETGQSAARDLLEILNDILDISKIEADQLNLTLHPFKIVDLLDEIKKRLDLMAQEKGIELIFTPHPNIPPVLLGDELRIRQIIINLIGNAIKFTNQGQVNLWIEAKELVVENDKNEQKKCQIHCRIADTGIGIPTDKQESIFNSFNQVDSSTTRCRSGTGLGLTICRQLIDLMGGHIWVNSRVGRGSTFHFTLNLAIISEENFCKNVEAETSDGLSNAKTKLKILVIEDAPANRMLVRAVLQRKGHQVEEAENGVEGLKKLLEQDFDVILMDVQMPKMDGLTATRAIRAYEQGLEIKSPLLISLESELKTRLLGGHLPIIAMTAHAMSGDRDRCLEAGMDDYLTKPFQPENLMEALVRNNIGKKRRSRTAS